MNEKTDEAKPLVDEPENLAYSLPVILVIFLIAYGLYLVARSGGPTDPRMAFYVIAGVATISVAAGLLIQIWAHETMVLLYSAFPYAVLILGGAVYYMVLMSSIDALGIFLVVSGHWGIASLLWVVKDELKSEKGESPQTDTMT